MSSAGSPDLILQPHPLCPLSAAEIEHAAALLRSALPGAPELHFKAIMLDEPDRAMMLPYLDTEYAIIRPRNGEQRGEAATAKTLPKIDRRAFGIYSIRNTNIMHEAIINLSQYAVESNVRLGPGFHPPADANEILMVEKKVFACKEVQAELQALELPPGTRFLCDPWAYGADGFGHVQRMYQAYLYMGDPNNPNFADSNYYAFPLPFSPVLDAGTLQVIRIDRLPTGAGMNVRNLKRGGPAKIHPPSEYTPEHQTLRTDLKPLNIVQPEGTSFRVTKVGDTMEIIEWQKWCFRVGFNQREGTVLYDIRYDGRSLFYRIALSDMCIPYADPRPPFHRKQAFDLGDVGAGVMANNLQLGCDCLGAIHYMSGVLADDNGKPDSRPNAICIHEQDGGILWKHTNFRTERPAVVRKRELVVQTIITVGNYEYILSYTLDQAGELSYDVRATGIVSTQPIDEGVSVPWGTVVHPGVLASHHQHIFSLRVDPAIDGHHNALMTSEVHPLPSPTDCGLDNANKNGYVESETMVQHSTGLNLDESVNRSFKIANPAFRNPVNGKLVAYKIHVPSFQKILAHPSSVSHKRAEFADHNLYVTRYNKHEIYAGGAYTNQSRGGQGVRAWAARHDDLTGLENTATPSISADRHTTTATAHYRPTTTTIPATPTLSARGSDIVVWIQFGLQHIVRAEDWPVMPVESVSVKFRPCNFFAKNPALDVPPSAQAVNRSVAIDSEEGGVGGTGAGAGGGCH